MWLKDGKLNSRPELLAQIDGLSVERWQEIAPEILALFKHRRATIWHKRISAELAVYKTTLSARKEAGKAGGLAKARNIRENSLANAVAKTIAKPTYLEPEPEPVREVSMAIEALAVGDLDQRAWNEAVRVLTAQGGMSVQAREPSSANS